MMFSNMPDDILYQIEFHTMYLLYREKMGELLDELTLKKTTKANMVGCIFLNLTGSVPELDEVEYAYQHLERLPPLEDCVR